MGSGRVRILVPIFITVSDYGSHASDEVQHRIEIEYFIARRRVELMQKKKHNKIARCLTLCKNIIASCIMLCKISQLTTQICYVRYFNNVNVITLGCFVFDQQCLILLWKQHSVYLKPSKVQEILLTKS